jgi:hypothetical protein
VLVVAETLKFAVIETLERNIKVVGSAASVLRLDAPELIAQEPNA